MRKIFLTVNTDTADLRYTSSPSDVITNPADAPQIYSGEEVVFCVSFIGADLQPVTFAETDTFDFGIDTNYDHTDDLMAYTDQVNIDGDWPGADVTAGKLSFRVNCATTGMVDKLANFDDLQVVLEIRQFTAGSTAPSVLCQAPAVAHNTVIGVDPSDPASEAYLTAAQVTAITDALAEDVTAAQTAAETAQSTATAAQTAAETAQSTATAAQTAAETAQSTATAAQTAANSKITAPATTGTDGQVLTLSGGSPVWATPASGTPTNFSTSGTHLTSGSLYTASTNGLIYINCDMGPGDEVTVVVNTITRFRFAPDGTTFSNFYYTYIVFAGQSYTVAYPSGTGLALFYPEA